MFTNLDCQNWAGRLEATADPELVMYYNTDDIQWRHVIDNQISSVAIPQGYSLKLYDADGFVESNSQVLNGQPWHDSIHSMTCVNLNEIGWDDRVSSVAVYRTNHGAVAQGRWQSFTSTESVDFKYHIGMSSTDSRATKESMSYSMTQDMSMGMDFWGMSFSAGISNTYSSAIEVDTSSDFTQNVDIEWEISCTGEKGPDGGVGLWQFVVDNSDGSVMTQTRHTVCRYGELYNKSPNCPWNACANGDCSECLDGWQE